MSMRTVAVTGASGGIGSALCRRLSSDCEVRTLFRRETDLTAAARAEGSRVVLGDLSDDAALRDLVAGAEVVFHCAAAVTSGLAAARHVNVEGTRRLAKNAAEAGCKRFVHFSSIAVYRGAHSPSGLYGEGLEIHESPQMDPYALTKWQSELAVRDVCDGTGMDFTILRPTCVYGPGLDSWTVMPVNAIRKGLPIRFGRKDGGMNAVYIDDVVEAAIQSAHDVAGANQVFNVGGAAVPTAEFLGYYARLVGRRPRRIRTPGLRAILAGGHLVNSLIPLPADKDPRLLGLMAFCTNAPPGVDQFPSTRLRDRMSVHPQVSLAEGMHETQHWLRQAGLVPERSETFTQAVWNFRFRPRHVERPANERQLCETVKEAVDQHRKIRAIGSLHSFSKVSVAEETCLCLNHYQDPMFADGDLVTIPAGARLSQVNKFVASKGLALPVLGSISEQTISGAIATGVHGGSYHQPSLTQAVESIRFVDGTGTVRELDRSDKRFFGAVQSMGLCGVTSTITLRCVPEFWSRSTCRVMPFDEVLEEFDFLQEENDFVEMFWHPVIDKVEVWAVNRIEGPLPNNELQSIQLPRGGRFGRISARCGFDLLHRHWFPRVHRRVVAGRIGNWYTQREGRSDFVLAYTPFDRERCFPMDDLEFGISYEDTRMCALELRDYFDRVRRYPMLGVRLRAQSPDEFWLSAAYRRQVCWIEMFNARGNLDFRCDMHALLAQFHYRPHWGKDLWMDPGYFAQVYPEWNRFQRLRREFDPHDLFVNEYLTPCFATENSPVWPGAVSAAAAESETSVNV